METDKNGQDNRSRANLLVVLIVVSAFLFGLFPAFLAAIYLPGKNLSEAISVFAPGAATDQQDFLLPVDIKVNKVKALKNGRFTAEVTLYNQYKETYRLDSLDFQNESIGDKVRILRSYPAYSYKETEKNSYQSLYYDDFVLSPDKPARFTFTGRYDGDVTTLLMTVYVVENGSYRSALLRIVK